MGTRPGTGGGDFLRILYPWPGPHSDPVHSLIHKVRGWAEAPLPRNTRPTGCSSPCHAREKDSRVKKYGKCLLKMQTSCNSVFQPQPQPRSHSSLPQQRDSTCQSPPSPRMLLCVPVLMVFKATLSTLLHRHTHNKYKLQAPSPSAKGFSNIVLL